MIDDFYAMQADLPAAFCGTAHEAKDPVAVWVRRPTPARLRLPKPSLASCALPRIPDLAMLVVASRQLRQVLG